MPGPRIIPINKDTDAPVTRQDIWMVIAPGARLLLLLRFGDKAKEVAHLMYQAGAAERERCAKICDRLGGVGFVWPANEEFYEAVKLAAQQMRSGEKNG